MPCATEQICTHESHEWMWKSVTVIKQFTWLLPWHGQKIYELIIVNINLNKFSFLFWLMRHQKNKQASYNVAADRFETFSSSFRFASNTSRALFTASWTSNPRTWETHSPTKQPEALEFKPWLVNWWPGQLNWDKSHKVIQVQSPKIQISHLPYWFQASSDLNKEYIGVVTWTGAAWIHNSIPCLKLSGLGHAFNVFDWFAQWCCHQLWSCCTLIECL